jgi:4-amino-4-deoxy-L-arabinose transferase-like glycosyltransferase
VVSRRASHLIFFFAFAAILLAMHWPLLTLPFHWDELGQFVPAALDLYRDGAWVPHSALPNVHPPGVMLLLTGVWKIFGFSILSSRLTMLAIATVGVYLSFLLAIRLSRKSPEAPAIAAVVFLIAAPLFYTQSMMVLLDMPAMTLTVLSLLLFLDERYAACALATTALVLVKETAISTPMVFAAWLCFCEKGPREKRVREALYFLAPALALGLWLVELHHVTGYWLGNDEFAQFNVNQSLSFSHVMYAIGRRIYALFLSDGHFLGAAALIAGWRLLRGKEWTIAGLVAVSQTVVVTVFGGAVLDRYMLPVLPILYAAFAVAALAWSRRVRLCVQGAMVTLFVVGWFWNPPVPFPYENNLAMVDFVRLDQQAAEYLENHLADRRIATAWPFFDALERPEGGYVQRPLNVTQRLNGVRLADLTQVNPKDFDVLVLYSAVWSVKGRMLDFEPVRSVVHAFLDPNVSATDEEVRATLGFVPVLRWERGGQWIEIYLPMTEPRQ